LKEGNASVKNRMEGLESITLEIRHFFDKLNYTDVANEHFKNAKENKEAVLEKIFGKAYKLIQDFNDKAKNLESEAQKVGEVSLSLNKKNKGD